MSSWQRLVKRIAIMEKLLAYHRKKERESFNYVKATTMDGKVDNDVIRNTMRHKKYVYAYIHTCIHVTSSSIFCDLVAISSYDNASAHFAEHLPDTFTMHTRLARQRTIPPVW